jgi:RNA-dependent RNA polymerase
MALEDRGVERETFLELQNKAKANIYLSSDSMDKFGQLLRDHGLGRKYHLGFILEQLLKLQLDFKGSVNKKAIKSAFFERLLRYSMHHALREIKFKARIPVPKSYQLVGVADEGRAYINEGLNEDEVFTLKPGTIYGTSLRRLAGVVHPHAYYDI